MSFISTGIREVALKVRRQRTRLALRREKRHLQKAEIALGREGTAEAANFPEVRSEIVALKKLEQEQKEVAVRIAKLEEALKQLDLQRQENARELALVLGKLEEEKKPLVDRQNETRAAVERCEKELKTVDQRIEEKETAERELMKKISALQTMEPPPADSESQMAQLNAQIARLPGEKAELVHARLGSAEAARSAKERLTLDDAAVAQADKHIAKIRAEFESRDRTLNESSRAQQEELRQARQQHQTVEEKKNPAYLNIGRHLASRGIAPPSAPHLLTNVQRHRTAVDRHGQHKQALAELSAKIDKQELRKFYFTIFSLLILLAIALPLASQSPTKRDWLPAQTSAILSLEIEQFNKNALPKRWRKEQPETWGKIAAGLLGSAARTPAIDLPRAVGRVTRALTLDERGHESEYVLVETRNDLAPVLRVIGKDNSFTKTTVSGLAVWQKSDISIARVGPKTLAVGSLGEVDELVQVRLGSEPDLKTDDPLWKSFQSLDQSSAVRLVARDSADLNRLFLPVFSPDLLAGIRSFALEATFDNPAKGHLVVRAIDRAKAEEIAKGLHDDPARWLNLPGSDFVLSAQPPKVGQKDDEVDLKFEIPEGAARLLLLRLARVTSPPAPVAGQ